MLLITQVSVSPKVVGYQIEQSLAQSANVQALEKAVAATRDVVSGAEANVVKGC